MPVWLLRARPCGGGARAIVVGVPATGTSTQRRRRPSARRRLLEAELPDVEVDRAIGVGDGDTHAADLREIELGHRILLARRSFPLRQPPVAQLIARRCHPRDRYPRPMLRLIGTVVLYVLGLGFFRPLGGIGAAADAIERWGACRRRAASALRRASDERSPFLVDRDGPRRRGRRFLQRVRRHRRRAMRRRPRSRGRRD